MGLSGSQLEHDMPWRHASWGTYWAHNRQTRRSPLTSGTFHELVHLLVPHFIHNLCQLSIQTLHLNFIINIIFFYSWMCPVRLFYNVMSWSLCTVMWKDYFWIVPVVLSGSCYYKYTIFKETKTDLNRFCDWKLNGCESDLDLIFGLSPIDVRQDLVIECLFNFQAF